MVSLTPDDIAIISFSKDNCELCQQNNLEIEESIAILKTADVRDIIVFNGKFNDDPAYKLFSIHEESAPLVVVLDTYKVYHNQSTISSGEIISTIEKVRDVEIGIYD